MVKKVKVHTRRVVLKPFEAALPATFPTGQQRSSNLTRTATLKEWLIHWLDDVIAVTREPTTLYCYSNIVNSHLIPALGRVRLCDLTPSLIQSGCQAIQYANIIFCSIQHFKWHIGKEF